MRWCAALAVVLVALVVVTVRGLRRPPRRPPPTDAELAAIDDPPPESAAPRATWTAASRRPSEGIAQLRGRVLFPAGVPPSDELDVVAEDASRRVTARITDDRFDLHLPPGRYTLLASAGPLVGVVPDVLAGAGATRDVDIRLAPGATIEGTLHTPDDVSGEVAIAAVRNGGAVESGEATLEDGRFTIAGLIAGRQYDLTFRGAGLRKLTLTGVSAPADGLDVELRAHAEIRGAIGMVDGSGCPISTVALQVAGKPIVGDDEEEVATDVGEDCHFTLAVPDEAVMVTVVAVGDGWHLEEQVTIPPRGDPEPICLNPPCRSAPERARLQLTLEGTPTPRELSATVTSDELVPNEHGVRSCSTNGSACEMEGLKPGATFLIMGKGLDCRASPRRITVVPGDNHVRLPCVRERTIEGVVRTPPGEWQGRVSVRCPGDDDQRAVSGTRLFQLTCRADATAIEYQVGTTGIWRSVPVASTSQEDPGFVDIAPL